MKKTLNIHEAKPHFFCATVPVRLYQSMDDGSNPAWRRKTERSSLSVHDTRSDPSLGTMGMCRDTKEEPEAPPSQDSLAQHEHDRTR
jgi:hypothetical protein